jgi:hypothetical protein
MKGDHDWKDGQLFLKGIKKQHQREKRKLKEKC